jgi:hypothetical protein
MGRASDAQKAERLNRARVLLAQFDQLPDAVERLARDCSISPRQAYRYVQQAQRLKEPVAVTESKLVSSRPLQQPLDTLPIPSPLCWNCFSSTWALPVLSVNGPMVDRLGREVKPLAATRDLSCCPIFQTVGY